MKRLLLVLLWLLCLAGWAALVLADAMGATVHAGPPQGWTPLKTGLVVGNGALTVSLIFSTLYLVVNSLSSKEE